MVKSQEWLDKAFPKGGWINSNGKKEERKDVEILDFTNLNLEGDLDLKDFTFEKWLPGAYIPRFEIHIGGNPQLGTIKNRSKHSRILIDAQGWLNWKYPNKKEVKKIELKKEEIWGELTISDFPKLEWIEVGGCGGKGKLTKLLISSCLQLKKINCHHNELRELIITNCPNLLEMNASDNQLINLDLSNNQQLEILDIRSNNFLKNGLSLVSNLINLKYLGLRNNHLTGSLEPLRNLNKLEKLDISNTDISHGLEYLPRSVKVVMCFFTQRPKARVSDIWEELQPFDNDYHEYKLIKGNLEKWREVRLDKNLDLVMSPLLPPQLAKKIKPKNKLLENHNILEPNYNEIHFNQWEKNEFLAPNELPIKLYNIKTEKVEWTENNFKMKSYAVLSYVWGSRKDKEAAEKIKITYQKGDREYEKKLTMAKWGKKALVKASTACKFFKIDYLWMDQLCIDQKNLEERNQEVPKMSSYYGNAEITLIPINIELDEESNYLNILKKIINSEWFSRSWTYQEGWLSKHTIFMFDDKLVDGWVMAGTWALNQLSYANEGRYNSRNEFNKGSKKIATPVGWTYYRDGYSRKDKVEMSLHQALKAIKNRKRGTPIDGVYSILGLLPYGEQVRVDYSKTPEQALYETMKVAFGYREKIEPENYVPKFRETIKKTLSDGRLIIEYKQKNNCYGEPLAWHGVSNTNPSLCWMPQVDENGSTSIEGGIDINHHMTFFDEDHFIEGKGFVLNSNMYTICKINSNIHKIEENFEAENGFYRKDVEVKLEIEKWYYESEEHFKKRKEDVKKTKSINPTKISLLGTRETIDLVEVNKFLLVPDRERWQSKKPFALLVENTGEKGKFIAWEKRETESNIYHRLGLVELENEEKLQREKWKMAIIGTSSLQTEQLQSYQEIPPK